MGMLVAPESPSDDVTRMPAVQSRKGPRSAPLTMSPALAE